MVSDSESTHQCFSNQPKMQNKFSQSLPVATSRMDAPPRSPATKSAGQTTPVKRWIPFQLISKEELREWHSSATTEKKNLLAVNILAEIGSQIRSSDRAYGGTEEETRKKLEERFLDKVSTPDLLQKEFNAFTIPDGLTNQWMIVRPREFASMFSNVYLPATSAPQHLMFFYNIESKTFHWNITPPELSDCPSVELLVREHALLSLGDSLLELIYHMARTDHTDCDVTLELRRNSLGAARELEMINHFDQFRDEKKCCYNYLLLDPRPFGEREERDAVSFHQFISSTFYVGKGTDERPFSHLKSTVDMNAQSITNNFGQSFKKNKIREIWNSGRGVIVMMLFTNISGDEALFRESCLIKARVSREFPRFVTKYENCHWRNTMLGTFDLVNKKIEEAALEGLEDEQKWEEKDFKEVGARLLLRAYGIFRLERCQEQYEGDVKASMREKSESNSPALHRSQIGFGFTTPTRHNSPLAAQQSRRSPFAQSSRQPSIFDHFGSKRKRTSSGEESNNEL